jgi:hypothetical protein
VSPSSEILALFSEPIRKFGGDLIENEDIPGLFSLRLDNQWGPEVEFSGTISDDRMQITLHPTMTLNEEQTYFSELHSFKVEDDAGTVIYYPEATIFTTGLFVNVDETIDPTRIYAFPSPFTERLNVVAKAGTLHRVTIFDSSGKEIISENISARRININTTHLPEGLYFIKVVENGGNVVVLKGIKTL